MFRRRTGKDHSRTNFRNYLIVLPTMMMLKIMIEIHIVVMKLMMLMINLHIVVMKIMIVVTMTIKKKEEMMITMLPILVITMILTTMMRLHGDLFGG